jgi:hypothetical protein
LVSSFRRSSFIRAYLTDWTLLLLLLLLLGIPEEKWVATCVLVDKLDKVELETLSKEIEGIGLTMEAMKQLTDLLKVFLNFFFFSLLYYVGSLLTYDMYIR